MVAKDMGVPPQAETEKGTGGSGTGPSEEADWEWFTARPIGAEYLEFTANAELVRVVWETYTRFRRFREWPFIIIGQDGAFRAMADSLMSAVEEAIRHRGIVFSLRSRNAWRPVWPPDRPTGARHPHNCHYEPVRLKRFQGIIEGWENRPKARLFAND